MTRGSPTAANICELVVTHFNQGKSAPEIANWLSLGPSTVYDIMADYRLLGAVRGRRKNARCRRKLSRKQLEVLRVIVEANPGLFCDELAVLLARRLGFYTIPGLVYRYIVKPVSDHGLGFTLKKVRAAPPPPPLLPPPPPRSPTPRWVHGRPHCPSLCQMEKRAQQQKWDLRKAYRERVQGLHPEQLVFVDEA